LFCTFLSLFRSFWTNFDSKSHQWCRFLAIKCSIVIRGFKICGTLTERIYREYPLRYKSKGKYHCTINLLKTGLDMAVVDINKNFLYNPVRPAFWEVYGMWYFFFFKGVNVPWYLLRMTRAACNVKPNLGPIHTQYSYAQYCDIAIKRYCNKKMKRHFLSKYCCYIPKSSQMNRNKYFQFTQWKKILVEKCLFIFLSQYLIIAILWAKKSRVNKATDRQSSMWTKDGT